MNRPIKFRAWNVETNEFIYSDKRDLETQLFRLFDFLKEMQVLGNYDVCLQQFTGLLDKNNKEIFEGDIIRIQISDDPEDLQWELIDVQFKNGCFWLDRKFKEPLYQIGANEEGEIEVIGNIFESPELMIR